MEENLLSFSIFIKTCALLKIHKRFFLAFRRSTFMCCSMQSTAENFFKSILSFFYSSIDLDSCAMSSAIFILLLLSHFVLELKGFSSFFAPDLDKNFFLRERFFFWALFGFEKILNYLHWYSCGVNALYKSSGFCQIMN